ncbi:MAG: hypothetical protein K6B65_04805 [Bacilli bacterium]|nr:hypothetical protein [Bacilli bacterium]
MKNKALKLGIPAIALFGLVGAGFAFGGNHVAEVKADGDHNFRAQAGYTAGDTIFLEAKNTWDVDSAKYAIYFAGQGVTPKWSTQVNLDEYKVAVGTANDVSGIYAYTLPDTFTETYTTVQVCRYGGDIPALPTDGWNRTDAITATRTTNAIYLPATPGTSGGEVFAYTDYYTISVGGQSSLMLYHTAAEKKATFTASKGDTVSVTYGIDANAGTLHPNTLYSNNITSAFKLKVGGEVTVYLTIDGWGTWVSGYIGTEETALQNFCDHLLANTISDGVCYTTNWGALKSEYTALGESLQTAFKGASTTYSEGYASVISEAKDRYIYLVNSRGVEDFASLSAQASYNISTTVDNHSANIVIVATIGIVAVLAISAAFVFAKRKEN